MGDDGEGDGDGVVEEEEGDGGAGGCADLARGCWEVVRRDKRLLMVMMLMRLVV